MGDLADILAREANPEPRAPKGWEPGIQWDGHRGTLTTAPLDGEPDPAVWAELVKDWDLDPGKVQIVPGSLQFRGWDAPVGDGQVKRLRYYRATIVDRTPGVDHADVERLCDAAMRRKPTREPVETANPAFVVSWNDHQIGKGEGGGTEATVARLIDSFGRVKDRLKELERLKRRPSHVVIANTGDPIEKVSGHYPAQAFTADLNEREQLRVARRLLFRLVDQCVTAGYPVMVTAVPCNHGENRNGSGKAQTTPDDNASLTIVENVQEICEANPDRYGAVEFAYAREYELVIPVNGVNLGMLHGHQFDRNGKGVPIQKVESWWLEQMMGRTPVSAADILMTAHKHHLAFSENTSRMCLIAPAMDGGSLWYTSRTGRWSHPGMFTWTVGDGHLRGWGDMEIL